MQKRSRISRIVSLSLVVLILASAFAACGGDTTTDSSAAPGSGTASPAASGGTDPAPTSGDEAPFEISIMTRTGTAEPPTADNVIIKEIERITNTKLKIEWVAAAAYDEKVNATVDSNDYPMIMLFGSGDKRKTVEVEAVRAGMFWKVGDYIQNYEYLKDLDPGTIANASIDGELWGMFRTRPLVRNGLYYRKDWADKLGLSDPKNLDELTAMLRAFVNDDPDGNGQNDTGGVAQEESINLVIAMLSSWYGIGNGWEVIDGQLRAAHFNPEYINMLNYIKMLYDEGLMNRDFPTTSATQRDEMMAGKYGMAIVSIDKGDLSMVPLKQLYPDADFNVMVNFADSPHPIIGRSGFDGLYDVSTKAVKTEDEFLKIMEFFNHMYSPEINNLIYRGIENDHYTKTGDNTVTISDEQSARYTLEVTPMEQLGMRYTANCYVVENLPHYNAQFEAFFAGAYKGPIAADPTASYLAETYTDKGSDLRLLIEDARVKYVTGAIDEAGWNAELECWKQGGGDQLTAEYQAIYESQN
jgi:putative aldouronate transport system substrate-binding protein